MAVDEKTKRALKTFEEQSKKYIKALPEKEKKKKQKKEARLRRLLRLMKMAALGKHYGRPKKKRKVGGLYAGYGRRTVAPKTK